MKVIPRSTLTGKYWGGRKIVEEKQPPTEEQIRAILESPCTSYWLKDAIRSLESRDCLDAARDAETLAWIASARAEK